MNRWYELTVKAPEGNGYTTPQSMKRVDEHLNQCNAVFNAPDGIPIMNLNGSFDLRVYEESSLKYVKYILTNHYGLEIIKEVEHQ
jgi:hypothetical protein